ncbi:MAG TPA: hypothetical protein PKC18_05625, partial [Lacipirellulaceae bacterium]|nr:hypothetical protein [Lacipirellulaceae bacterium]
MSIRCAAVGLGLMTLATWCGGAAPLRADDAAAAPTFDLTPRLGPQAGCQATVTLEAGGELLVPAESGRGEKRLPLSIVARLEYQEQLVRWSDDMEQGARSVRRYTTATANTKTDAQSQELKLPENRRLAAVDSSDLGTAIRALDGPLTRDEFILLDAVGNTLVIDRLLPKRALAEGDGWDHDPGVMAALLGMDHIAVCEVRSVVTGQENGQVQIRLAGTVHGTVHGARTEMELRGAYLFHTQRGRISKLNLAIKELRKPGEAAPGLDLTARVSVVAAPLPLTDELAQDLDKPAWPTTQHDWYMLARVLHYGSRHDILLSALLLDELDVAEWIYERIPLLPGS